MLTKLKHATTGLIALSLAGCSVVNTCRTEARPIEYLFSIGQLTLNPSELDLKPQKALKKRNILEKSNKRTQTK